MWETAVRTQQGCSWRPAPRRVPEGDHWGQRQAGRGARAGQQQEQESRGEKERCRFRTSHEVGVTAAGHHGGAAGDTPSLHLRLG